MRITSVLLAGVLSLCGHAAAQIRGCSPEAHSFPDDLRSRLDSRLATFLTAQSEGRWGDVAELLGNKTFFREGSYKQCLVSRMQELRMVSFDLSTPDLYTCTTQTNLLPGIVPRVTAEQLSWYVRGMARFQTSSETWVEETQIRAYRDQSQWYFIPPQQSMQDKWEKIHYTEADFSRDHRDEIVIRNSASSPIEITDLHSYMIRKFPSVRNVEFTLHNKTPKNVIALSIKFANENEKGAVVMSGPYQIKPNGQLTLKEDVPAYADFCAGVFKHTIVVTDASFADGSKWDFKEPSASGK
jgi:hypothetical protein